MNTKLLSIDQLQDLLEIRKEIGDLQARYDAILSSPAGDPAVPPARAESKPKPKPAGPVSTLRSFAAAPGKSKTHPKKAMSAESRARIAQAQKERWAVRKAGPTPATPAPNPGPQAPAPVLSVVPVAVEAVAPATPVIAQ